MRAFIEIHIPENEKINFFIKELKKFKEVKTVDPKNLHICLKFLGNITEKDVDKIKEKMDAVKGTGKFSFDLKGVGVFPDWEFMKVIWIGTNDAESKLKELNSVLEKELETIGFQKEKRKFTAHLTAGRVRRKSSSILRGVIVCHEGEKFATVNATEVRLMKSELRSFGPRYWVLHSVDL